MGRYLCNEDWINEEREKPEEQNAGGMEEYLRRQHGQDLG
jgi:hypothetical protein